MQYFGIFLTSLSLTCSLVPNEDTPNLSMTPTHKKPFEETLASPPLMLKRKIVVYFVLPHKWSITVCSERPSGKNCITQKPVKRFPSQINLLVPIWHKSTPMEIHPKDTPIFENLCISLCNLHNFYNLYNLYKQIQMRLI